MPLVNKGLFALFFLVSIPLVITGQRILTIYSAVVLGVLSILRLWVWWNHGRLQKNMYTNCCRAFLSVVMDVEIVLIAIKIDNRVNLKVSTLCAITWIMLPFFVTTGILTFVALINRIVNTCRKRDTSYLSGISMFLWLFLVFGGGPGLMYFLVYELQLIPGTVYNFTEKIELASLLMGCYGLGMCFFHMIIVKSFR